MAFIVYTFLAGFLIAGLQRVQLEHQRSKRLALQKELEDIYPNPLERSQALAKHSERQEIRIAVTLLLLCLLLLVLRLDLLWLLLP